MPYSYITFPQAVSVLAQRLQDPTQTYWNQPNELLNCLYESVRYFQALTGSYKQKISFSTQLQVSYYHLPRLSTAMSYNVTDIEVANNVLAALLEPPLPATGAWVGTGQFTFTQLQSALQNRLNRFLGDTGCRTVQQLIAGPPPPVELVTLPDGVIDVRRAAWVLLPSGFTWAELQQAWQSANFPWNTQVAAAYPLGRLDEWAQQAYIPGGVQQPSQPLSYSVFGTAPLQLRLVPPPGNEGNGVDCLFVQAGPTVNLSAVSPVLLEIPDDLSPAVKWGTLADLLGSDGPSRDYQRAEYCESRYQEFVVLASIYPSLLTADINNITCGTGSVFDMDFYMPDWQQTLGSPSFVGMAGRNLACIGTLPDSGPASNGYGVGLWLCANAPVSTTGYLQVSRDQIDPVLDYAQHIASFKMGGVEFNGTVRLQQNMIDAAKHQNDRLSAVAFYRDRLQQSAQRGQMEVARM